MAEIKKKKETDDCERDDDSDASNGASAGSDRPCKSVRSNETRRTSRLDSTRPTTTMMMPGKRSGGSGGNRKANRWTNENDSVWMSDGLGGRESERKRAGDSRKEEEEAAEKKQTGEQTGGGLTTTHKPKQKTKKRWPKWPQIEHERIERTSWTRKRTKLIFERWRQQRRIRRMTKGMVVISNDETSEREIIKKKKNKINHQKNQSERVRFWSQKQKKKTK